MRTFTINAIGYDGATYPVYFECETIEDAENIINKLGLMTDNAGLCEMVWKAGIHEDEEY